MEIIPKVISRFHLIIEIKNIFGLNEFPYLNMDEDLILISFIPKCYHVPDIKERLINKYYGCSRETLEFLGDKILSLVIISILDTFLGIGRSRNIYDDLYSRLGSNRLLTDIMLDKDACNLIRTQKYLIRETKGKFHNTCADSFKALIGALFIHLDENVLDYVTHIQYWLFKNTKFPLFFKEFLNERKLFKILVYLINNRKKILDTLLSYYNTLIFNLKQQKDDYDPEIYANILKGYSDEIKITENILPEVAYIVNKSDTIDNILSILGWR